jgi:ParB-like chromosome segregation protein Spo0J/ABC-type transport system involved in cytochrome c biogenesis ATPase subunit/N-acetylglutamate synthase-like GNAT family acetyltransferase
LSSSELELQIPPAELVDVEKLHVDKENPNVMSGRQFEALKKSIKRWGFIVPIITNRDYLVADGEHRLEAAKALSMKQVSVIRLPVSDVDRRMIRQVMNKIRGEHDLFLDAEEYYRLVSEGSRDLLKAMLNENDLRIDNLLRLREPAVYSDEDLKALAERFKTRLESSTLDKDWEKEHPKEPLTLNCHAEFSTKAEVTKRTLAVCEAFGLGVDEAQHFVIFDNFRLDFHRGDLIYLTGDSGGGKTLLLKAFKRFFGDEAIELDGLNIDPEETLIEGVGADVKEAIEILSLCGLNDAFLFLRKYKELSDGQKYRYRLAKLIDNKEKSVWILDEFCATLDRVMARIIAYLVQKVARKYGKTVIVATTHQDLLEDFQPNIIVDKGYERDVKVTDCHVEPGKCSICKDISIRKGAVEDYEGLSRFHYRSKEDEEPESLRIKDCYKLLFKDEIIGVIVYSHSYLNLKPRNMVFGERYLYTPGEFHKARLINEEIARISRVVIHPKFRGIGLGAFLVKETMPKVDAKVIETLAVMARYNPFFEKAGMVRVDYRRDETSMEKKPKIFLEGRNFDFDFLRSETYCRSFFSQLSDKDKKTLLNYLSEFSSQPFIKVDRIEPGLLAKVSSSDCVYLYWVNQAKVE